MKSGTTDKMKFKQLKRRLKLALWQARGLLDALWDFTRNDAPDGAIGRYSNEEIAVTIEWLDDPDELIDALIKSRWIDEDGTHRLIVHDWPDHCEDSVHKSLARRVQKFANGTLPNFTRLTGQERSHLYKKWSEKYGVQIKTHFYPCSDAHKADSDALGRTEDALSAGLGCQPEPVPEPEPGPIPEPIPNTGTEPEPARASSPRLQRTARSAGVFANISEDTLRQTGRLLAWFNSAAKLKPPPVAGEADRIRVVAAAERALEHGANPAALFVRIVKDRDWKLITQDQEERARRRLVEFERNGKPPPSQTAAVKSVPTDPNQDEQKARVLRELAKAGAKS